MPVAEIMKREIDIAMRGRDAMEQEMSGAFLMLNIVTPGYGFILVSIHTGHIIR